MINLGNPELAFGLSSLPADGVGLARLEFIINEYVKAHPMALLHPERVDRRGGAARDRGHGRGLALGRGSTSSPGSRRVWARSPPPSGRATVIVRLSDFKTNEYAALLGGQAFEPREENPMLGFRGASRYAHPAYREAFAHGMRGDAPGPRERMGLKNLKVMVPFCRRLDEADRVLAAMAEEGLERGRGRARGLRHVRDPVERHPDRPSSPSASTASRSAPTTSPSSRSVSTATAQMVAFDFDERDPAVMAFLKQAVEGARRNGRHCGICGQAPSDYPEMAEFLVGCGIDSISVTPDVLLRTIRTVRAAEARQGRPSAAIVGQRDLRGENHAHPPHPGDARARPPRGPRRPREHGAQRRQGHGRARLRQHPRHGRRRLLGIFTERDLLMRVAAAGRDLDRTAISAR